VTFDRYGPPEVLRVSDIERPAPGDGEVLVRVHATTATRSDCGLRSAEYLVGRFFTGLVRVDTHQKTGSVVLTVC
jgi:NADPH:quinone reductase-like Zn-dependent oxidoreductase